MVGADAVAGVEVEPMGRQSFCSDAGVEMYLAAPEPLRLSVQPGQ